MYVMIVTSTIIDSMLIFKGKDKPSDLFPYSSKCDIYSFGLVFHEIAVGMSPWVDYVYQVCSTQGFTTSTLSEPDDIIMKVQFDTHLINTCFCLVLAG